MPQLRTRHQSRGVGSESDDYWDRELPELRLVWPDRNTSHRPGAAQEASFSRVIAFTLKWEVPVADAFSCLASYACTPARIR